MNTPQYPYHGGDREDLNFPTTGTVQNHMTEHDSIFTPIEQQKTQVITENLGKALQSDLSSLPTSQVAYHFLTLFSHGGDIITIFDKAKEYFKETKNLKGLIYLINNKNTIMESGKNYRENYKKSINEFITQHVVEPRHPHDVSVNKPDRIAHLLSQWYDISNGNGNNISLRKSLLQQSQNPQDPQYDTKTVLFQEDANKILDSKIQDENRFLDECCSILKIR